MAGAKVVKLKVLIGVVEVTRISAFNCHNRSLRNTLLKSGLANASSNSVFSFTCVVIYDKYWSITPRSLGSLD